MIPLFKCSTNDSDIKAVTNVIQRGTSWAEGPEIEEFEKGLCKYLNIPGLLVCNSGTSALHMAMLACGIKHFHEVIVPSFTFIATANCVRFVGATPIFADIEPEFFGLDPGDVEKRITGKTKAIIAVHYAGHACHIQELRVIARKYRLFLIEDNAEALGAQLNQLYTGKFGDCAILSFCQNKIITTGEGGALITDNKYIYDKARLIRSHGREEGNYFNSDKPLDYVELGYNFRMSSMGAALGISQLSRIEDIIAKRIQIAHQYSELLKCNDIVLPKSVGRHVYQLFTIRVPSHKRDSLIAHLATRGIGSKVYFPPVHLTTYYKRNQWQIPRLPVTEQISKEVLSLPIYPDMTENEVQQVCQTIKEAL